MNVRSPTSRSNRLITSYLSVLLSFLFLSCSKPTIEPSEPLDVYAQYLDLQIPTVMNRLDIPGVSMALIRDGHMVWSGAWGVADLKSGRPMTPETICRVESISKSVTAWGVMKLVEQGHLRMDAPISEYLSGWAFPDSDFSTDQITIAKLLSNTGGLALGTIGEEYAPHRTMPSIQEYLQRDTRLIYEPGTQFSYSNTGFNYLELIIEKVTGRPFADYMNEQILDPLGMEQASFNWIDSLHASFPTGYELDGEPVAPYVYPVKASGGLFANAEDIARFVGAQMTGNSVDSEQNVLSRQSVQNLHTPTIEIPGLFGMVADHYGYGHFIETLPDGTTAIWHGGQGHGWMTHFHAVPLTGDGIVVLTNSQRSWPFMARILDDWARWSGHQSVKMGRIKTANSIFLLIVALAYLVSFWLLFRLGYDLWNGRRTFHPLSQKYRLYRTAQAMMGLFLFLVLIWGYAQPYLMISTIFPVTIGWATVALALLAAGLMLYALFPNRLLDVPNN